MKRILTLLVFLFIVSLITPSSSFSQRGIQVKDPEKQRLALVIGNGNYKSGPLRNPVNDAKDMAQALRGMGFEVLHMENASFQVMDKAVMDFGRRLRGGGVGLFYFAGHGIQVDGTNYLLPVDAEIETESDLRYKALDAGRVLGKMEDAENVLNIVILDACRNNPFARSFRSSNAGLAKMDAPKGSLVAYATAPGSVADDGTERNGVYTKSLLEHMNTPGLKVEEVLKKVRNDVMRETGDKQVPWEHSSLRGDFYFITEGKAKAADVPPKAEAITGHSVRAPVDKEALFWESIKDSSEPADYEAYLEQFPEGTFAPLARRRIEEKKEKAEIAALPSRSAPKGRLFVHAEPEGATVRILNIKPRFDQGMELDPGRYHVEVSAKGFQTSRQWIDLDADKEKRFAVRLAEEVNTGGSLSEKISDPKEIIAIDGRGNRYVAYASGVVRDTRTGLDWLAGPDRDTSWDEARAWVKGLNIDGGGWRMPTERELKSLYGRNVGTRNMTPLLKTTGWRVWSDSSSARPFGLPYGKRGWADRRDSDSSRAFAVRSRKDG